jgi:glutamine amidotransferase
MESRQFTGVVGPESIRARGCQGLTFGASKVYLTPMRKIGVVGYDMGNVTSLCNALIALGEQPFVARTAEELEPATHVILPGVGAFPRAMQELGRRGFTEPLRRIGREGKRPLLGICLGMQLLATTGEEHEVCDGLGLIPGRVTKLEGESLRVPHIGWNDTTAKRTDGLMESAAATFYYVHSYRVVPDDKQVVSMECDYGGPFAAAIQAGTVFGVQFHPEKSHANGLAVLRRFLEVPTC